MPFIRHDGRNVLFVHIPRTGGTSVEKWLADIAPLNLYALGIPPFSRVTPQHYTRNDIKSLFSDGFFDYVFTIVRDPYGRIESEYKLRWVNGQQGFWRGSEEFPQWLESQIDAARHNKFVLDNHIRRQVDFLGSDVKVFRFEDGIDSIVAKIVAATGLPAPKEIGRHYDSAAFPKPLVWDLQDRLKVNEFYAEDFKNLGYSLERAAP